MNDRSQSGLYSDYLKGEYDPTGWQSQWRRDLEEWRKNQEGKRDAKKARKAA